MDMSGKVALVTGAGSGIGRASALAFAAAGARVLVADLHQSAGERTAQLIAEQGGEAAFRLCDVSDAGSVSRVVEDTVREFHRLDYGHNNAGLESALAPTAQSQEENFDRMIAVNLKGVWLCMRAELTQMLKQGGGSIVNTSSVGGLGAVPMGAAYAAAKHGVIGLTRSAAVEYAAQNIRVNAICPGLTETPLMRRLSEKAPGSLEKLLPPMRRVATPEEIADWVIFMCSESAAYMTGQAVVVDGGAKAF